MSDEGIKSPSAPNSIIDPSLDYWSDKIRVKFNGSCLKQDKITYAHKTIVNIYIVYEINKNYNIDRYPTLENCLFGAVSLTKHPDLDEYKYFGYAIEFDRKEKFSIGNGFGRNCKGPTQGLDGTTLTAEKKYSMNFTENNKKFCSSLHYNGANSYLFVNGTEIHKLKIKDSEIVATSLCLGNISKNFSIDNMKTTGLNGHVYDFSVDYDATAVDNILGIHKYLIKKNNII